MTARASYDYRGLSRLVRGKVEAEGIGYRAAAAEIGVTASDLSRISAGQGIAFEKVVAICDWLGIEPRDLYEAPSHGVTSTKADCCSAAHVKHPLPHTADPADGRAAPAGPSDGLSA